METVVYAAETAAHEAGREALLDRVMGPVRFRRASERIREGRLPAEGLALVALDSGGKVVGTVRLWDAKACGGADLLMLGPLAVDPAFAGSGIGSALMRLAIARARELGHGAIVLVGDPGYYERFGFAAHKARRLAMPGPFERHRMLGLELQPGALERAHGTIKPDGRAVPVAVPALAEAA